MRKIRTMTRVNIVTINIIMIIDNPDMGGVGHLIMTIGMMIVLTILRTTITTMITLGTMIVVTMILARHDNHSYYFDWHTYSSQHWVDDRPYNSGRNFVNPLLLPNPPSFTFTGPCQVCGRHGDDTCLQIE